MSSWFCMFDKIVLKPLEEKKMPRSTCILFLSIFISCIHANSEMYQYHPSSRLYLGGGFLFVSGEGSVQLENESTFQSDSLSWLLLFKSDYGRYVLRNPRLQPELSDMPEDLLYERYESFSCSTYPIYHDAY